VMIDQENYNILSFISSDLNDSSTGIVQFRYNGAAINIAVAGVSRLTTRSTNACSQMKLIHSDNGNNHQLFSHISKCTLGVLALH
jgi:hypothetical protein